MKTSEPQNPTQQKASSPEELLQQEQAEAFEDLQQAAASLWFWSLSATDLRGRVRRHPGAAVGLAVLAGFIAGPALVRTVVSGKRPGSRAMRAVLFQALRRVTRCEGQA